MGCWGSCSTRTANGARLDAKGRRRIAVVAAGLLLLSSNTARADERTEARAHFKKGIRAIAQGKYEQGIPELERAYETLPHPNVLYNIARAHAEAGDLEAAIAAYRRYLETEPDDRREIQSVVQNLENRLARQQTTLAEARTRPRVALAPESPRPAGQGAVGSVEARKEGLGEAKTEDVFAETVVTASRGKESPLDAESSTSIITEQDIRLSGITKIPELLRRLAGIDVMETTGSQTEVSIRGFNQRLSNKVLVLVDGRSVYIDLLGATFWQSLSIGVEDVERVEVVRGPGSALYGADAFGGVINIITKKPGEGGSGATIGYGDHSATHVSSWASGKRSDFSWRAGTGYDILPRWSREVPPGRGDLHLATPDQNSSSRTARIDLRGNQRVGKDISVGLGAGFSEGSLEVLGIGPFNDVALTDFQSSDVTAKVTSPHVEGRIFWNRFRTTFGLNAAPIGQSLLPGNADSNVVDGEVQFVAKNSFGGGPASEGGGRGPAGGRLANDLHVGLGYRFKQIEWTYLDALRTENHEAIFVHDALALTPRLSLVADARLDYVPYLSRLIPSPKGSAVFHPSRVSTLRGSVGTAFRSPTFLESYLDLPIQLPAAGASASSKGVRDDQPLFKLQPENILTAEVGYQNQESDLFSFDATFFFDRVSNLSVLADNRAVSVADVRNGLGKFDPQTGTYPVFFGGFDNQCQVQDALGGEAGAKVFPAEGLDFYANYTYERVSQNESGCSAAARTHLVQDARTSEHKVNAGAQIRTKRGVDGSLDFHYVSPQTWAEQVNDVAAQRITTRAFRVMAYTLVNARLGIRLLRDQLELAAVGWNLLGSVHREHPFGQEVGRRAMLLATYRF